MTQCIIIVFDSQKCAHDISEIDCICPHEIKAICDFDDRWRIFERYCDKPNLCRDSEGLVYDNYFDTTVYGLILER